MTATTCADVSDRMPEVAQGRSTWSAGEAQHLAGCEECRLEWDLVHRTMQLGARTGLQVDVAGVTDAVLRRLRTTPAEPPRRRVWVFAGLAAAAAVVVVIWSKPVLTPGRSATAPRESVAVATPVETAQLKLPVPELEDLEAPELQLLVEMLNRPFRADEPLESPSWEDWESRAFERELNAWEG